MGPLSALEMTKLGHLGPTSFLMAFETWNSGQQSPGYMLDKFGPSILGLTGPRAHIVHTSKNSSNVPKFHVTPVETICNTNENLNFYLFWSFLRPKRAQIYGPRGHDSHTPGITFDILVNQVSWLHSTNFFPKMTQNLNFELFCSFSGQKYPTNMVPGGHGLCTPESTSAMPVN